MYSKAVSAGTPEVKTPRLTSSSLIDERISTRGAAGGGRTWVGGRVTSARMEKEGVRAQCDVAGDGSETGDGLGGCRRDEGK